MTTKRKIHRWPANFREARCKRCLWRRRGRFRASGGFLCWEYSYHDDGTTTPWETKRPVPSCGSAP